MSPLVTNDLDRKKNIQDQMRISSEEIEVEELFKYQTYEESEIRESAEMLCYKCYNIIMLYIQGD